MKRIAHVLSTAEYSGAEKIALEICDFLKNDYEFIYVCKKGSLQEYLMEKNVRFIIYSNILELISILKNNKFDIVHSHDYKASIIASIFSKGKVISHIHCNAPFAKTFNIKSFLYYISSKNIDKILCVSNSIANEMYFKSRMKSKININYNWVNERERLWQKEEKECIDILFVGRFNEVKNPILFLEVIKEVKNRYSKELKVTMIGRGELKVQIESFILNNQLEDNVQIVDFNNYPHKYMKKSKIFFVPSKWEGFGLVFLEALINGCVVVSTPVGGIKEIFKENNKYLLNSKKEFIDTIMELLNNDSKRLEYLEENKKIKENFKMDFRIDNIKKIYDELLFDKKY